MKGSNLFTRVDTIILRVGEVNEAKNWYVEKLGLSVMYTDDQESLVVLKIDDGCSLTLWQLGSEEEVARGATTGCYPILAVEDARRIHELLSARGVDVEPLTQGKGICYFQFRDLEGNVLEACQVLA